MTDHRRRVRVVAVSDDPGSETAFRYCLSNATKGDSIHVLTAREEKKRFPDKDGRIDEAKIANFNKGQEELAESVLYKYKQFCADEGRDCVFSQVGVPSSGGSNSVGHGICRYVEEHDASDLYVGTSTKGSFSRLMQGSVSLFCVQECNSNVTVVKKDE